MRNQSRLILFAFTLILLVGGAGCKSKKKAAEAANAAKEKQRIEMEASQRRDREAEERRMAEEQARKDAEAKERERQSAASAPKAKLEQYFAAITNSGNLSSANTSINEALTLFASDKTPVLIVISEEGGQKDYDRPTNIRDYLNYLKDQKKNMNRIGSIQVNDANKITEVELIKEN